jgi:adenosylhomocysteinase
MARGKLLRFPMFSVNDADCKHLFDNRYGTGQSVWDGIMRTTNLIVAGKTAVVAGYGWCGKGVAMRAKGLGAKVIITETDPVRALEATMDGFGVMPMSEAAGLGDMFICVTGCRDIITGEHFKKMRSGAILCNAGHFNVEIDLDALAAASVSRYEARENIEGFVLPDGRELFVLAQGRLVNIAAGDGHPAEIMDMSFAVQALSAEYLAKNAGHLNPGVHAVPAEIDSAVARLKLNAMGLSIDALSRAQADYLGL